MFNQAEFKTSYEASLKALAKAEKVTKAELLTLSRSVLEAHHETQDVSYINRLLPVLSPVNKRAAVEYFKVFSGFMYDMKGNTFTKKDKKEYDKANAAAFTFLEDPLNNIWTWSERELVMEAKPFDMDRLKKALESTLKKAAENDITQLQVMEAMLEAGLGMDTLLGLMAKIEGKDVAA